MRRDDDTDIDGLADLRSRRAARAAGKRRKLLMGLGVVALAVIFGGGIAGVMVVRASLKPGGIQAALTPTEKITAERHKAIIQSFEENPVAAKKTYAGKRWELVCEVSWITPPVTVRSRERGADYRLTMRSNEIEKVKIGRTYAFEVVIVSCRRLPIDQWWLASSEWEFTEAKVIGERPELPR